MGPIRGVIMAFRPPQGVRPPQLEGKRTGRPKGSATLTRALRNAVWGFVHRYTGLAKPPCGDALLWLRFAWHYPDQMETFLHNMLPYSSRERAELIEARYLSGKKRR